MGKTIALLASLDTKYEETIYAKNFIRSAGYQTLLIDVSTKTILEGKADISPVELLEHYGMTWEEFDPLNKADSIDIMSKATSKEIPALYEKGCFDGIISIGGGQNARMAATAMKSLPFGVPKLVASSLACGKRIMEQYVGSKDILVMHTVADISGLNSISKTVIHSACGAIMGMVDHAERVDPETGIKVVGATMLGITSKGIERALRQLDKQGYETVVFHANGVGGRCMEDLIKEKSIDVALDLTLHEITCEVIGGYCVGATNRLMAAVDTKTPMVVSIGALDMVDYYIDEQGNGLPDNIDERKKIYHNSSICHCKIFLSEVDPIVSTVAERLNKATAPVTLLLPTKGGCEAAAPGGPMYDPEVDAAMIKAFKEKVNSNVKVVTIDANINDVEFSEAIVREALLISE